MKPLELLNEKRDEIVALCQRYAVKRLRVFGSALSGDWDESRSDFDFLVDYSPEARDLPPLQRLVGLQLALEDLLGRKVDVVNCASVRNPFFRDAVEQTARELYAA